MKLTAWGRYPVIQANKTSFKNITDLKAKINASNSVIAFGNGRSYGDCALNTEVINIRPWNYFLSFDEKTGLLHIQAGVLLSEIIEHFVPRGWFLKITPGTKLITIGGAIASDVHGKNHHIAGCFSECVKDLNLMLANGETITCSKTQYQDFFQATCGGQGLTGIILDARIYLKKINSKNIEQTTTKTENLNETFAAFENNKQAPYSVAWIDCLAKKQAVGRCLLMTGDFAQDGNLKYKPPTPKNIPFNFPTFALNKWSVRAFNNLYYHRIRKKITNQIVGIDSFFYPLDAINNWNKIYGKNGFVQYQIIIPKQTSFFGIKELLRAISNSGKGSFLAILKLYGKSNSNWLSFPFEGYSLALDFKMENGLFEFLNKLDEIVIKHQGRVYLTKDVRVPKTTFEQGYPHIETFRQFRKLHKMDLKFQSLQSNRLHL